MRCRDAKHKLVAQRDGDKPESDSSTLQEHLQMCSACRSFEEGQHHLDHLFQTSLPSHQNMHQDQNVMHKGISTEQIMQAVHRQQRITQQLEDIRKQQQSRMARWSPIGSAVAAITFFTLGSVPLLLLAITILQTDLMIKALSALNGVIDSLVILASYCQEGVLVVTRDSWLLSGLAFAVVVMMGMWLHLMRPPQGA